MYIRSLHIQLEPALRVFATSQAQYWLDMTLNGARRCTNATHIPGNCRQGKSASTLGSESLAMPSWTAGLHMSWLSKSLGQSDWLYGR